MPVRPSTRFNVFKRDKFTCSYCGRTPPVDDPDADWYHPYCQERRGG